MSKKKAKVEVQVTCPMTDKQAQDYLFQRSEPMMQLSVFSHIEKCEECRMIVETQDGVLTRCFALLAEQARRDAKMRENRPNLIAD